MHAVLTIDVARCGDDESIAKVYVLKPENVDLHGLLHGMVPLLVPDVPASWFFPAGTFNCAVCMCGNLGREGKWGAMYLPCYCLRVFQLYISWEKA